jgi:hypothetical protein
VLLFAEVCDVEAVLPTVVFDMEALVLEEGINVEIEDVAELIELEVPAPCSAKMVPKVGTKVEDEQQLPLYAQHHDPPVFAALQASTLTELLFPAV